MQISPVFQALDKDSFISLRKNSFITKSCIIIFIATCSLLASFAFGIFCGFSTACLATLVATVLWGVCFIITCICLRVDRSPLAQFYSGLITDIDRIKLPLEEDEKLPECPFIRRMEDISNIRTFVWDCRVHKKGLKGSSIYYGYGNGVADTNYKEFVSKAVEGSEFIHKNNYRYLLGIAKKIRDPSILDKQKVAAMEILMDSMLFCLNGKIEGLQKAYNLLVRSRQEDVEKSVFYHIAKLKEVLITEPWNHCLDHVEYWNFARASLLGGEWGLPPLSGVASLSGRLSAKQIRIMKRCLEKTFCDASSFTKAVQALINEELATCYHSKYYDFLVKTVRVAELEVNQSAQDFVAKNFFSENGLELLEAGAVRILFALRLLGPKASRRKHLEWCCLK